MQSPEIELSPTDSVPGGATSPKKNRADGQISGLSGEFFVAAELLKREIQTSITLGNAKSVDLIAYNERTKRTFTIQVKTLRKPNYFLIDFRKVEARHVYIFVLLNAPGENVNYYIVPGKTLLDELQRFGKDFQLEKMPGILPKKLKDFESNWSVFAEAGET